jgi:hypothetical protein
MRKWLIDWKDVCSSAERGADTQHLSNREQRVVNWVKGGQLLI